MPRPATASALILMVVACQSANVPAASERAAVAERFFRGLYTCDTTVVDSLAARDVAVSYPIFETVYGKPAIRGREEVRAFVTRFCRRWTDAVVVINESVAQDDRVVFLWSFRARNIGPGPGGQTPDSAEHSWGGISLFRFDSAGRVLAEVGEESTPGPAARLTGP